MPGLTVTEKEHWKDRIGKRIDKKIEVVSAEDPNLLDRVHREARERALASLGLSKMQQELDEVEQQKSALEKRERQIERAMLAHVRGVPVEDIDDYHSYRYDHEVDSAVNRRQAVHEDELLAESENGQRILQLREEKDNLLDTVWLATSPKQIKELWSKVADLLGDDQTQLQRDALAIVPAEE
ncbi:hypothetical protein Pan97_16610 [Bremerella volcania]|uniref:Uncharacterized protein n=1 Tax=Bremerella volcania TaxID=2527984 RepID=A0A518C606_9BACT|nr:hypothetical protein [Bremerella volcania]QDU74649.1 hypothetical protein Pan97_16610 [Bremerella volcania]